MRGRDKKLVKKRRRERLCFGVLEGLRPSAFSFPFLFFSVSPCYNGVNFRLVSMSLASVFSGFSAFGFSGSRSLSGVSLAALRAACGAVPAPASVFVGCASGVDAAVRSAFPSAVVFSVASGSFGSGRGAFAARSVAVVRAVAAAGGLWVSFPSSSCPAGLLPSASSSRCFCGAGSGSWASLAFAVGLGVPAVVFCPAGVPSGWGFSPVSGAPGWFSFVPVAAPVVVQLSLF